MTRVGPRHRDNRSAPDPRALFAIIAIAIAIIPILAMVRVRLAFDDVLPDPILGHGIWLDEVLFGAFSVVGAGVGLVMIVAPIAGWLWVHRRADAVFLVISVLGAITLGRIAKVVAAAPRPVASGEEAFAVHGVPELLMGAMVLGLLLLAIRPRWRPLALSVAAMITLTFALAVATDALIPVRYMFDGFPSGHATGSMAATAALVALARPTRARVVVLLGGAVLTAGVGLSRVYLGAHYPADVVAGWCIALTWVAVVWYGRRLVEAGTDRSSSSTTSACGSGPGPID